MEKSRRMFFKRIFAPFLSCALLTAGIHGESWSFANRNIKEILFSISTYTGIPIAADDTVSGSADFYFSGDDFETGFDSFLKANRLYVQKKPELWTVSRISILKNGSQFLLDACDVQPDTLFEKLSIVLGCGISFEGLGSQTLTIHKSFLTADEIIRFIARQISDCTVTEKEGSFHVGKAVKTSARVASSAIIFESGNGLYCADIKSAALSDALESLFTAGKKQFCLMGNGTEKIERLSVSEFDFETLLHLVCTQGNCEAVLKDAVWYIVPSKNVKTVLTRSGKDWELFELRFTDVKDILPAFETRFPQTEILVLPGGRKFFALIEKNKIDEMRGFIELADAPQKSRAVNLKYISVKDFLTHLPPSVQKGDIVDAGTGNSFFFTGSEQSYEKLLSDISLSDKPVQRIRYDLLIMQYENTSSLDWSSSFGTKKLQLGDMNSMTAQLGSVLSFNLDVVSAFGLNFAAQMQASIQDNKAHVFADTTLHGVSGATINFQNTNTYRYRDNNLDPETGKPVYSGITREIISGLKLDVQGWVSGDGMITSKVTASVSRRGTDVSSTTGNPPPTSEKIITTEVQCKSGEPVVLSGLVQSAESETSERTPFLSKIPLLGIFFKGEHKTQEMTDIVIYLVPHWENGENKSSAFASAVSSEQKEKNLESDYIRIEKIFKTVVRPETGEELK